MFAVKYLQKGIEYTRYVSNDRTDKSIKLGMFGLFFVYELYLLSALLVIYNRMPVFKPVGVKTDVECSILYNQY